MDSNPQGYILRTFPLTLPIFHQGSVFSTFPLLACRLPAGGSICSPDGASVVRVGRLQNRQLSDIACEKEKPGWQR